MADAAPAVRAAVFDANRAYGSGIDHAVLTDWVATPVCGLPASYGVHGPASSRCVALDGDCRRGVFDAARGCCDEWDMPAGMGAASTVPSTARSSRLDRMAITTEINTGIATTATTRTATVRTASARTTKLVTTAATTTARICATASARVSHRQLSRLQVGCWALPRGWSPCGSTPHHRVSNSGTWRLRAIRARSSFASMVFLWRPCPGHRQDIAHASASARPAHWASRPSTSALAHRTASYARSTSRAASRSTPILHTARPTTSAPQAVNSMRCPRWSASARETSASRVPRSPVRLSRAASTRAASPSSRALA